MKSEVDKFNFTLTQGSNEDGTFIEIAILFDAKSKEATALNVDVEKLDDSLVEVDESSVLDDDCDNKNDDTALEV
ncbi:hypothetical protein WICMUC_003538 [Wickerhamomyces mucosus]|uniref:Uncharacterized protein n=1 Tax=Wickerhamomyces mucosus TaxID=1378264 RepID=A0A9P8PLD5_9ASCO|nr:hypothetical protein WICMUC_003538 [Wickerhamomyces mucosus]